VKIYNKIKINIETGLVTYEDSYNYQGVITYCKGGGTTISPPTPTPEEIELQKLQLELLQQQKAEYGEMKPFILRSMGLRIDADGSIVKMTEEERLAEMTEAERNQYELALKGQERQARAYEGDLDISPALEKGLSGQKTKIEEALSRRLGPNWQLTTAGQQAMGGFEERASLVREEARQSVIAGGSGNALASLGYLSDVGTKQYGQAGGFPGRTGGLFSGAGQAMQPYQQQRSMQYNAMMHNAMMRSQSRSGLMGGFGSLLGAGIQAYGTYAGLAASARILKKNIRTIQHPIEKILDMRGVDFDWKQDGSHSKGVIAEELECVIPEAVHVVDGLRAVEYHLIIPVLIEAIKEQQRQIDVLRGV
jgi:hypothetical protein